MAKLFVISAPSGAGKTTLVEVMLRVFHQLERSISTTTRLPRVGEVQGISYFFVTEEEFKEGILGDTFAEHAEVHGAWYGTTHAFLKDKLDAGISVVLAIDVQGAKSLKQLYADLCVTCFIETPSLQVLEDRLRRRGTDSEEAIQKRLRAAVREIQESHWFQYRLINDRLEDTITRMVQIFEQEGCQRAHGSRA
jgi:guanylate kinase